MAELEHDVQVTVLAWAKMAPGVELWRNRSCDYTRRGRKSAADKGRKGSPDLEGWVDGFYLGVELKRPGGRTEPKRAEQQAAWRERILRAGGCHIQADDLLHVIEGVEEFRRKKGGPTFGL